LYVAVPSPAAGPGARHVDDRVLRCRRHGQSRRVRTAHGRRRSPHALRRRSQGRHKKAAVRQQSAKRRAEFMTDLHWPGLRRRVRSSRRNLSAAGFKVLNRPQNFSGFLKKWTFGPAEGRVCVWQVSAEPCATEFDAARHGVATLAQALRHASFIWWAASRSGGGKGRTPERRLAGQVRRRKQSQPDHLHPAGRL